MEKAITLIRVSTKSQDNKQQLPDNRDYAKNNNFEIVKVFKEKDSAYKKDFQERKVWQELLSYAKENNIKHLIVWNMDRYSRLEPERVLKYTSYLSSEYGLKIHAVKGDVWSDLVLSISKLNELGHIGKTLSNFLEELLKGLEHQRAYQESLIKSDRVKLKIDKSSGVTKSTYGNKWGAKKRIRYKRLDDLLKEEPKLTIRQLAERTNISKTSVHKYLKSKKKDENAEK